MPGTKHRKNMSAVGFGVFLCAHLSLLFFIVLAITIII